MPPDEDEGEEVEDEGGGQFLLKGEGVEAKAGGPLLSKAKKKSDLEVPLSFDASISYHQNGVSLTEISGNDNENNNQEQRHKTADQSVISKLTKTFSITMQW